MAIPNHAWGGGVLRINGRAPVARVTTLPVHPPKYQVAFYKNWNWRGDLTTFGSKEEAERYAEMLVVMEAGP